MKKYLATITGVLEAYDDQPRKDLENDLFEEAVKHLDLEELDVILVEDI